MLFDTFFGKKPTKENLPSLIHNGHGVCWNTLINYAQIARQTQIPYDVRYPVKISTGQSKIPHVGYASDISISGMRLHTSAKVAEEISQCNRVTLSFEIQPGTLPEGLEMQVKTDAHAAWPPQEVLLQKLADVKSGKLSADTEFAFGVQFEHNLLEYSNKHHARYELMTASFLLFTVSLPAHFC